MAYLKNSMVDLLLYWMIERQAIYKAKQANKPKPWTEDPVLIEYRFCNVYREQDTVSKWIAENWRDPNSTDPDLWFAMLVARYINEPATLELLGYPLPWRSRDWLTVVRTQQERKVNVFNAAYIIPPTAGSAIGGTTVGGPKHEALSRFFTHFWEQRRSMRPIENQKLADYADKLCTVPGMGRFFAGQIIADLKYAHGNALWKSPDWWTFAISGPGSRRGLNRIMGNPVKQSWKEADWFATLSELRENINDRIKHSSLSKLHGQDMQNCLCEFDKYQRVLLNEGHPKQKYNGRACNG